MKKKLILFVGFILVLFLLAGCTKEKKNEEENDDIDNTPIQQTLKIEDYFPMRENVRYVYEGEGNEYASYDVIIDYISGNRIQQRVNNGGTVMAKIFEIEDGELKQLYSRAEVYYRENLLDQKGEEEILLMDPLEVGTTWELRDGSKRTITNISADITTPSGSFKAIEVQTEGEESTMYDYYAKDIGLVKSIFKFEDFQVTSSLSKIEENFSFSQTVNFYYPDINDGNLYYIGRKINFRTNDITRQVMEDTFKLPLNENMGSVFSENTKINSLYLNDDGTVYIDLNSRFVEEMNAGAGYESMILQSIVNTVAQYYYADKVVLTIDHKPYESGHIIMDEGEYSEPNYENVIEVK